MLKYLYKNEQIPQNKRKELNEKVIFLLNNPNLLSKYKVTPEDVYNIYTGRGQTEDINFKDYDNYYSYSQERKKIEEGEFFTSPNVCKFVMDILQSSNTDLIADMTAGIGRFCNHAPIESNMYLNDNNINNVKIMRYLYPNSTITNDDIQNFKSTTKFDLVVGNPPYGLKFGSYTSQFYYCIKANELLKPLGLLAIVMPNSFINDEFMDKSIVEYMNKHFSFVCQIELPTDSFKQVGIQKIETKIIIFQKKSESINDIEYKKFDFSKVTITELSGSLAQKIHEKYIRPLQKQKENLKAKLFYETVHTSHNKDDEEFNFKVQKLLFDIKRNPKLVKYYSKAVEYYNNYFTQQKPENIDWKEWNEIRITKKKVIKYLKNILGKQNKVEQDVIKLVKWNYGLKLKGYSDKTEQYVSKLNDSEISFNNMILNDNYYFEDKSYLKLLNKKQKEYTRQNKDFNEILENGNIKSYLNSTYLYDHENEEEIFLNEKQNHDINLALQKQYSYLAWETGAGKSLSSLIYGLYRLDHNKLRNIFVVAPAIAIKNTYAPMLENFKIPFIVIKDIKDINNIKEGQFILMTFNALAKNCISNSESSKSNKHDIRLCRFVKKFIKRHGNNKFCLILDEADQISNINSLRSQSVLNTFRKLKYKLLCSATNIRNNLSEFKTALDLMYNNSINMLSTTEYIYTTDKETGELKEELNTYYNKPIPPYKEGFGLYTSMFNPHKTTVLGISKYNQDIYSKDELKKIINKTLLIRTLKDITGRDLYKINQIPCSFSDNEKNLYIQILEEFNSMMEYHIKTGNSRKDSMFRILAQLNTLLKSCSIPQTFRQYVGGTPTKFKEVFKLLNKFENEVVAIGCTRIKTVNLYANEIKKRYPERPLFIITGNETTFKKRRKIIAQLKESDNGILLSTMQSLSCSVSIPFVDTVITVENLWNDSACQQYRARFTRYNSDNVTSIYNLFYKDSIEANLMKLILSKEKLCLLMKNEEIEDDEELYEKYGIDSWIFNCLMTKERDSEGNIKITWGEQNIV